MHLGRCHNCATQRHPDTMHNITAPHKGAAALGRTKNGKESEQKKLNPETMKELPPTNQGINYHSGCGPSAQPIRPSTQVRRNYPPHVGAPNKHWSFSRKLVCGLILPEPPSPLLLVSSGPASALILDSDAAQVIFQNQRSISEMRFRLPASLSDGISLPHHQIQAPGSFALMP